MRRLQADKLGSGQIADRAHAATSGLTRVVDARRSPASAIVKTLQEAVRICVVEERRRKPTAPAGAIARARLPAACCANARRFDTRAASSGAERERCSTPHVHGADSALAARLARSGVALALTRLGQPRRRRMAIFAASAGRRPFSSSERGGRLQGPAGDRLRGAQGRHDEALALLRGAVGFLCRRAPSEWARALAFADLGRRIAG